MRFTSYEFGAGARISTATEFAIFRPRAEADRLAVIAERIVVDFVMRGQTEIRSQRRGVLALLWQVDWNRVES